MGYTHYWYRDKEIDRDTFTKIADDFRKLLPIFARSDTPWCATIRIAGRRQLELPVVAWCSEEV